MWSETGRHDPHRHHDLSLQAPAPEAEGGRARCASGRHHEKEPPPNWRKSGGSGYSSISPPDHDGAAQPSTPGDAERDRAVTSPPPANDDRKSAIVTTTSRKRLKLLHAEKGSAGRDDDPEAMARVRAFFAKYVRPGGRR